MKTYFQIAAVAAVIGLCATPAYAKKDKPNKDEKASERLMRNHQAVGVFISRFTTDTLSFPGVFGGAEIPCTALLNNPDTPFVTTCDGELMVTNTPDGRTLQSGTPISVLNLIPDENGDNLAEAEFAITSDGMGRWQANTRTTSQSRVLSIGYNSDGTIASYRVTENRAQAKPDGSGSIGTFDSRTYGPDQDPLDINEPFTSRNLGTFETTRVQ